MPVSDYQPFVYQAKLVNIVDGDTFDYRLDLGFDINFGVRVRLLGVDTREIHFPSSDEGYERGMVHKGFSETWHQEGRERHDGEWPFLVATVYDRSGKYGRLLAVPFRKSDREVSLNQALLDEFDDVEEFGDW